VINELVIKIGRDEFSGYSFTVGTPGKEPYLSGTDNDPFGLLDTLGNEFYEIGWRDINDN